MSILSKEGVLLRIFIAETARCHGQVLYEAIVRKAQETGLAGATVFRGIMGFQRGHSMQTTKLLRFSDDLPVVIEIVDEKSQIDAFLPVVENMVTDGLITTEKANIIKYVNNQP
jgi:hypothetical protein